ncbi:MAG: Rdx family protein [Verrucomicrobia bacterium]|nr:Rdx family protein [Verrucomicrobiota bacterium]
MTDKLLKLKQTITSVTLVPSGGGAFEVSVNGQNIYSKLRTGQFPDPDSIVQAVRAKR